MTIEAPPHVKRLLLPGDRHLIDPPVTSDASDAFVYMNTVIEIHVVRKIINAGPLDWVAGLKTVSDRFQHRRVLPDLRMTSLIDGAWEHAKPEQA